MAGGLLNLVAYGNQNIILNSNPKKTFFKSTYAKYTNFGLQKFRIDYSGQNGLDLTTETKFTFYVPRYAELLMDTYIVINMPNIWSPILPYNIKDLLNLKSWAPYEFKWIDNLGTKMIKEVVISVGGQVLQKLSGNYLLALVERNYNGTQRDLYDRMTGNVPEMTNPAFFSTNNGHYPNAFYNYTTNLKGIEPSIRARTLYIPINAWFSMSSKMAFPLVALQYNQLQIDVTFRPIKELFVIRDIINSPDMGAMKGALSIQDGLPKLDSNGKTIYKDNNPIYDELFNGENEDGVQYSTYTKSKYIAPNFNIPEHQFHRFIQPPPNINLNYEGNVNWKWNADIHLMSTYCFLSSDESKIFARNTHKYLIKSVYETVYPNVTGSNTRALNNTYGMVSSWMFYYQRSDISARNEWSNYSNWAYNKIRSIPSVAAPTRNTDPKTKPQFDFFPGWNPIINHFTGYRINDVFNNKINNKNILISLGILFDGKYRENVMDMGVYNYLEKYTSGGGSAPDGLYCYNFCLNTEPRDFQPSGAINTSKFTRIEFEFTTITPPINTAVQVRTVCGDSGNGAPVATNMNVWDLNEYNYDLTILEERYNVITFVSGMCGLMYAR